MGSLYRPKKGRANGSGDSNNDAALIESMEIEKQVITGSGGASPKKNIWIKVKGWPKSMKFDS